VHRISVESGKGTDEGVPSVAGEGGVSGTSTVEGEGVDVEGVPEGDGIVGDGIIVGVSSVGGDGERKGGVQARGESCCSSSSHSSLSNSTLHLRLTAFLVRLAGGEEAI
jgi:hypothetical protein